MSSKNRILWLVAVIVIATCVAWYTFGSVFTLPGLSNIELGGDAIKNYYSYLYHATRGSGFHFTGMNYPYGEHIVFADGQAALSVPLSYINKFFPLSENAVIAVMHRAIVLSFILCIVYTYLLLQYYKVHPAAAILFSVCITVMSPQLFRVFGHYGLAYLCVIPMIFYWCVKYYDTSKWKFAVYFFLLGSYMSFMHPYYAGLILVWTGFYTIGYLLVTRASIAAYLKHLLPMVLAVTGVALVFKGLMFFTDNVTDRTNYPYGILSYCTSLGDLFVSEYSLFGTLLNSFSIRTSSSNEGFAYIGLVPIMVVCVILGICISSRIFRHRELERYGDEVVFPRIWIFIALSSLLLAMGIPFIWHMEWMLNYVSVIRQFRSLGRFSWVFYYIITVYGVIMLYAFCARKYASGKKAQAVLFLLLPMIIWALEANGYVITVRKKMEKATGNYRFYFAWNDPKDWKDILNEHHYIKDDFQAIMFLPYMNIGSDKLWLNGDCSWLYSLTTKAIMQLNLPMIDALMARTSWSQVFNQVKIIGGPFSDKPILRSINDKPILLLVGEDKKIDPDTHWLLQASDSLQHYSQAYVYALYPKRLIKNEKQVRDSVVALLPHINRDSLVGSNDYYFIEHFDKVNERGSIFWGNGSQDAIKERKKIVYTIPVSERADSALYEFSCWSLVNDHNYSSPGIFLDLYNASGNPISSIALAGIESTDNEGMWLRISKYFQLPANCRSISVRVINEPNPTYFALDEIVLRPADGITISKDADGKVLANNHVFRK